MYLVWIWCVFGVIGYQGRARARVIISSSKFKIIKIWYLCIWLSRGARACHNFKFKITIVFYITQQHMVLMWLILDAYDWTGIKHILNQIFSLKIFVCKWVLGFLNQLPICSNHDMYTGRRPLSLFWSKAPDLLRAQRVLGDTGPS